MTRTFALAALALVLTGAPTLAFADPTCAAQSDDKKLAGAAKTSFMKKCTADATASCDKQAADKKLAGAAKTSFTKKCVTDATGS
jgi:psiF repeat